MPAILSLFTEIETSKDMTIDPLVRRFFNLLERVGNSTPNGKVMQHVALSGNINIPRDDQFGFRAHAANLVDYWCQIRNANRPSTSGGYEEMHSDADWKMWDGSSAHKYHYEWCVAG
ncbi:hypothetical protein B0H11DRAFT_1904019 [Mycena galericulata]|nr:hypothetical protein B0H11DRAFT_1904019 [Mycena galericulata]